MNGLGPMLIILTDAFWAAFAALGFAVLFNVPRRALPGCIVAGALGHATRTALIEQGIAGEAAVLVGALVVGLIGELYYRRVQIPRLVINVPGVIPMVPGSLAFGAMQSLLSLSNVESGMALELLATAGIDIIRTLFMLMALGIGISIPILFRHNKPVACRLDHARHHLNQPTTAGKVFKHNEESKHHLHHGR